MAPSTLRKGSDCYLRPLTPKERELVEDNYELAMFAVWNLMDKGRLKGDAEDYLGAATLGLIRAAQTYKPKMGSFSTYAVHCAQIEALNEQRKNTNYSKRLVHVEDTVLQSIESNVSSSVDSLVEQEEINKAKYVLNNLPKVLSAGGAKGDVGNLVDVVIYCVAGGEDQREYAKRIGVSQQAVSKRKQKALQILRGKVFV